MSDESTSPSGVTFQLLSPPKPETLAVLPDDLREMLGRLNGFIAFRGGMHFRGSCDEPAWHSLEMVKTGELALHRLFDQVLSTDIPFAQDCVADQWLIREQEVHQLSSETGEVQATGLGLQEFLDAGQEDPLNVLGLHPLWAFLEEEGVEALEPGQVLVADPPFCIKTEGGETKLTAAPVEVAIRRLANIAAQVSQQRDGETITLQSGPAN